MRVRAASDRPCGSAGRLSRTSAIGSGVGIITGGLWCEALAPGRFALITLWDMLEHLDNHVAALTRARELLAPGGQVFLRVPNFPYLRLKHRIWTRLLGHERCFIPLVHWYNYDRRTPGLILKKANFTETKFRVGLPEVYGPLLRRFTQYLFYYLARIFGSRGPFCFSLEAWAQASERDD